VFLHRSYFIKTYIMKQLINAVLILLFSTTISAQQVSDTTYLPPTKASNVGAGTTVVIDEAHNNFHTLNGRYAPFAKVLTHSGYTVASSGETFTDRSLKGIKILVIANAINEVNLREWRTPTPSAFTKDEIIALNSWVKNGGSLFLISDHMPFAGAAKDLAKSFGFIFYNSFVRDTSKDNGPDIFTTASKTFNPRALSIPDIDSVATFTGQAFDIPSKATSIITFDSRYTILIPEEAWVFDKNVTALPAEGRSQLAIMNYGKGKIAVSGEAAMFTAQIAGATKVGMNSVDGKENHFLLVALIRWLM